MKLMIGRLNFSANFMPRERFAVSLGVRHAKVALHPLLGVAAFLGSQQEHLHFRENGPSRTEAPDHRRSGDRRESRSNRKRGALRNPENMDAADDAPALFCPGIDVKTDLLAQKIDLVLQVFQLQACFMISAGARF